MCPKSTERCDDRNEGWTAIKTYRKSKRPVNEYAEKRLKSGERKRAGIVERG
jgi:hypothetical protein